MALLLPLVWGGAGCGPADGPGSRSSAGPHPVGPALRGPLACDAPRLDFGSVYEGRVLRAGFDLRVEGERPVRVASARADCGCTATALLCAPADDPDAFVPYGFNNPLDPGDRLRLELSYDTRGKHGRVPREVTLYADIPGGRVKLGLLADVQAWLFAEPNELILGRMGTGETKGAELRVRSTGGEAFALRHDRRAVPPALTSELTPVSPDAQGRAKEWAVTLTLGPDLPEGAHQYPLYLISDHPLEGPPGSERIEASTTPQVIVEVVGRYTVQPGSFSLSDVKADSTVAATVRLHCHDQSFEQGLPKVRLEPAGAQATEGSRALLETASVSIRPSGQDEWDVQLLLEGLSSSVPQRFLALVVIETGNPSQPLVEVPVIGFRAAGGTPER